MTIKKPASEVIWMAKSIESGRLLVWAGAFTWDQVCTEMDQWQHWNGKYTIVRVRITEIKPKRKEKP